MPNDVATRVGGVAKGGQITLDGDSFEVVDSFKYLGVMFDKVGSTAAMVKQRV